MGEDGATVPAPMRAAIALAAALLPIAIVLGTAGAIVCGTSGAAAGAGGEAIVAVARAEYDRGEADGTHNAGGEKYWSWSGFGGRVEWCVCFVEWCAGQCGLVESGLFPPQGTASCSSVITWFREHPEKGTFHDNDGTYEPKAGDLALNGTEHIGIVEKGNGDKTFTTLEGNSPDRTSNWAYACGGSGWTLFITPAYPAGATGSGALMDGVDFALPEPAFVSEWGPRIDAFFERYNQAAGTAVPLSGYGDAFARSAYRHKVDPRLSPAISINESGGGRVCWLRYGEYDAWGWAADFPATNWPDAIEMHAEGLARGYGAMTSVDELAHKYAAGEPEENIQAWARHLEEYMGSM